MSFNTEEIIEEVYKKIIRAIHEELRDDEQIYPLTEKERRKKMIHILRQDCAFRLRSVLHPEEISPVYPGDLKFLFNGEKSVPFERFFRLIHPAYLAPYLLYAGFAYELARTVKTNRDRVLNATYQTQVPIKLPNQEYYRWYLQHAYVFTVNEHHQVASHINIYIPENSAPLFGDSEFDQNREYRFTEATVLRAGEVDEEFTALVREAWKNYLLEKLRRNPMPLRILSIKIVLPKLSNEEIAKKIFKNPNKRGVIAEENKKLIKLFADNTGYHFKDLQQMVSYCDFVGLSEDIKSQN